MCRKEGGVPSSFSWNQKLNGGGITTVQRYTFREDLLPVFFPDVLSHNFQCGWPPSSSANCLPICYFLCSRSRVVELWWWGFLVLHLWKEKDSKSYWRKKGMLSEMDKAYLMIQGISLGMESVNLIYGLNVLSWAGERSLAKCISHSCLGEQEGWHLWSNRASEPSPAQRLATVSEWGGAVAEHSNPLQVPTWRV